MGSGGLWRLVWMLPVLCGLGGPAQAQQRVLPLEQLRSGLSFAGSDVRALQADEFGNPAQLWLQRGEQRWAEPVGPAGKSCQQCHGAVQEGMRGVAARYPAVDRKSGQLLSLEDRIRQCRHSHQQGPELAHESEDLLGLSLYVTQASAGLPLRVDVSGAAQPHVLQGERLFMQRRGQLNLSCTQCHDQILAVAFIPTRSVRGSPMPIRFIGWNGKKLARWSGGCAAAWSGCGPSSHRGAICRCVSWRCTWAGVRRACPSRRRRFVSRGASTHRSG